MSSNQYNGLIEIVHKNPHVNNKKEEGAAYHKW